MMERAEVLSTPLLLAMGLGGLIAASVLLDPTLNMALVCIGAGFFVLAFFNRQAALYLIVPAMALSPEISVLGVPVRVDDLLMIPLVAGWLAQLCVSRERRKNAASGLLVAYFLVGVLATIWGTYLGTTHLLTVNRGDSSPFHLLKRLEFVLVAFIVADTLRTPRDVLRLAYVLMAAMIGMNALALQQFLVNRFAAIPLTGISGHEAGVATMIAVPMALSLIPASRPPVKVVLAAAALFSMAVLPLSLGRNFLVVTVLILLYVAFFQRQRWVLVLPVILVLALLLYPSHVRERVFSIEHLVKPDIAGEQDEPEALLLARARAPIYYASLALGDSPLLGFGIASVPLGFIDSEYSAQITYTGVVGVVIFLLLWGRMMKLAKQIVHAAQDLPSVCIAKGFQLVLVAYAYYGIFATSISPTHTGSFYFVIIGLIIVLHRWLARSGSEVSI